MKQGELNNAIRRALNMFDEWVETGGHVDKHTSVYYEMQAIIEDAVHCGAQAATGDYKKLEAEEDCNEDR